MTLSHQVELAQEAGKRTHHFHGGLRLRHNKKVSCQVAVERPPLPELLLVPLLQHAGDVTEPLVKVGDNVLKGQQLGQCEPCATVHSHVSGTIEAIEERPMSHPSGQPGPCVVIRPDGREQWVNLSPLSDWRNASSDSLI